MPLSNWSKPLYFVFDVESVGLHGEGFAVGWVVVDAEGNEHASACYACLPYLAWGKTPSDEDRAWVAEHVPVPHMGYNCSCPKHVREEFCRAWQFARGKGVTLVSDCPWPVEARFLATCVDEGLLAPQEWPYPLLDVASARLAAGLDPLDSGERLSREVPQHNPLCDARQSARLLVEALNVKVHLTQRLERCERDSV